MAGSYNHVVKEDGSLRSDERALGMLDCYHGDVFEALEEMYGMIWYLASEGVMGGGSGQLLMSEEDVRQEYLRRIEDARQNYTIGLAISPTKRYQAPRIKET